MSIYTHTAEGTRVRISPAPGEAPGEVEIIEGDDVETGPEPKETIQKPATTRQKAEKPAVTEPAEKDAS